MADQPLNDPAAVEELAGYLSAIGHAGRLDLLRQLRVPRTLREIQIRPVRPDEAGNPDRPISRNAVERHLKLLKSIGVVASRPRPAGRTAEEYVVQHSRLFQIVEELKALTALRPTVPLDVDHTVVDMARSPRPAVKGPQVTLLSGPEEGRVRPLSKDGPWVVGRSAESAIPLDYDPYVSSQHAEIVRKDEVFLVRDLPTNRNGTSVNWGLLPRGQVVPLRTGDVVRVGRSLLLFRADGES